MNSSLMRGRTLNPQAVDRAKRWRENRIRVLLGCNRLALTRKERAEARRLTGRLDFWNYKRKEVLTNG